MQALRSVSADELPSEALTNRDCDSPRQLLQLQGPDEKLRGTVRQLDIGFRSVRGSDSEKQSMRARFRSVRVRYGFSSLLC